MLGTGKMVTERNMFEELLYNSNSELFSSDLDTDSEPNPNYSNMTDISSTPTISNLIDPFAGKIDLHHKVGLSFFSKATEGLKGNFDFNIENARKRSKQSNAQIRPTFGAMFVSKSLLPRTMQTTI